MPFDKGKCKFVHDDSKVVHVFIFVPHHSTFKLYSRLLIPNQVFIKGCLFHHHCGLKCKKISSFAQRGTNSFDLTCKYAMPLVQTP